jgi:hypothetical protein
MACRPYLTREGIESVLTNPLRTEVQANGRIRRRTLLQDVGKYLRVVTEANGETVHHAFFDCRSGPESQEGVGTWLFNTIQTRICFTSNLPTG